MGDAWRSPGVFDKADLDDSRSHEQPAALQLHLLAASSRRTSARLRPRAAPLPYPAPTPIHSIDRDTGRLDGADEPRTVAAIGTPPRRGRNVTRRPVIRADQGDRPTSSWARAPGAASYSKPDGGERGTPLRRLPLLPRGLAAHPRPSGSPGVGIRSAGTSPRWPRHVPFCLPPGLSTRPFVTEAH